MGSDLEDLAAAVSPVMLANHESQQAFFCVLADQRRLSGKTEADVAAILGIDPAVVVDIEAGHLDLSFSELRQYAYAADILITYEVSYMPADVKEDADDAGDTYRD